MIRPFLIVCAAVAFASVGQAQCYESNLGSLLGVGDDTLLTLTPMNMTFPMPTGGVAASFTHIQPNTNGVIYLSNGAASGGSSTGYSTSATTMLTNMRGSAGNAPRIACYWRDLDMLAANSGGVYVNNTIPGKVVVTWKNAVHYGQTTPIFTCQVQMFSTGEVRMFYDGRLQNTSGGGTVGISVGNAVGASTTPATDMSLGTGNSTLGLMFETFATINTFDLRTKTLRFVPNGTNGYAQTLSDCVPASNAEFGRGCTFVSATAYESFAANTIDLANTSFRLTPNASGGYSFGPGSGASRYTHTVASLGLTDDSVATFALPSPLSYPGGTTSSLDICSNGYIWMQSPNTLADFSPTAAEMFSNPARLCPMWCDGLPDATNNVYAEAVGSMAYITYSNVPIFGGVGGVLDLQVQINLATGVIEVLYGSISCGNVALVGWTTGTAGGSVVDTGSRDWSSEIPGGFSTVSVEQRGLALVASPVPTLGTTLTWTTSNIPASAVVTGQIVSFVGINLGVDLTSIGAPSCRQYVVSAAGTSLLLFGGPSVSTSLVIPNNSAFAGVSLYAQSVSLDPASNAFGAVFSNGTNSFLQSF